MDSEQWLPRKCKVWFQCIARELVFFFPSNKSIVTINWPWHSVSISACSLALGWTFSQATLSLCHSTLQLVAKLRLPPASVELLLDIFFCSRQTKLMSAETSSSSVQVVLSGGCWNELKRSSVLYPMLYTSICTCVSSSLSFRPDALRRCSNRHLHLGHSS